MQIRTKTARALAITAEVNLEQADVIEVTGSFQDGDRTFSFAGTMERGGASFQYTDTQEPFDAYTTREFETALVAAIG